MKTYKYEEQKKEEPGAGCFFFFIFCCAAIWGVFVMFDYSFILGLAIILAALFICIACAAIAGGGVSVSDQPASPRARLYETKTTPPKDDNAPSYRVVPDEYFSLCVEQAEKLYDFLMEIERNDGFMQKVRWRTGLKDLDNTDNIFPYHSNRISFLYVGDLIACLHELGYQEQKDWNETTCLHLLAMRMIDFIKSPTHEKLQELRCRNVVTLNQAIRKIHKIRLQMGLGSSRYDFYMPNVLKAYAPELVARYWVLLYRFASVVAKADNEITPEESDWLAGLMRQAEMTEEMATADTPDTPMKKSVLPHQPQEELERLVGLMPVKEEIKKLTSFIQIQQVRKKQGLKTSPISYHCVFTGNPGTGKTTVARIVARIYRDLGILKKGHLVETDRSGLVAEYVGQTAVKTNKIIDSAMDGILFIDEAYSLAQGGDGDYGLEAIATLLKRMEDDRKRLVVILAGYSEEMTKFIEANPGLRSRFNRYIDFTDYNEEELYAIFESTMQRLDYQLEADAVGEVHAKIREAITHKDRTFGNARFIRNLFEKIMENQAIRLSQEGDLSKDSLQLIKKEDIESV